jgi:hypothetical protein
VEFVDESGGFVQPSLCSRGGTLFCVGGLIGNELAGVPPLGGECDLPAGIFECQLASSGLGSAFAPIPDHQGDDPDSSGQDRRNHGQGYAYDLVYIH